MSYIVLARKYRPQTFADVYAQDHVTKILINALENDRIAHAYLFSGPRGVGKTSMARILAKSLNCQEGGKGHPCNHCSTCEEITNGTSTDVVEIDGASNTGVDDIRDLQRDLLYTTNSSKYKIYIIDEVHMLSKNAFNALLKTLEEPPDNVIFIFATTEPHKVIPTIISRCQRFDFKRIPIDLIVKNLMSICKQEVLQYEEEALFQIAKKADGGMRDALSLMDQVISTGKEVISEDIVREVFGILPFEVYERILLSINSGNSAEVIRNLHAIIEMGNDIIEIVNGFLDYLRLCLLSCYDVETGEISKAQYQTIKSIVSKFDDQDLLYIITIIMKTKVDMKTGDNPAILLEIVLIKLSKIKDLVDIESVINPIQPIIVKQKVIYNEQVTNEQVPNNQVSAEQVRNIPNETIIKKQDTPLAPQTKIASPQLKQDEKAVPRKNTLKERLAEEFNSPANTTAYNSSEVKKEVVPSIESLGESTDNFDLEFVNKHWDKFIKLISQIDGVLASMLNYVTISSVSNRCIRVSTEKKMTSDILTNNKEQLSNYLKDFFQKSLNFEIDLNNNEMKETKELTMETIEKDIPELAKFIKDTKSKIINRISTKDIK